MLKTIGELEEGMKIETIEIGYTIYGWNKDSKYEEIAFEKK